MQKFIGEFKKFITRGNVLDLAVGVTVGAAFTAIVNGLSNYIFKPIINWILALIFDAESLNELYTFLKKSYVEIYNEAGQVVGKELDLSTSIYIDWGAFIGVLINFFIISFVLFLIVKISNNIIDGAEKVKKARLTRAERRALKQAGIKLYDFDAVKEFLEKKDEEEDRLKAEAERVAAEKKAEEERIAKENSPEEVLKQIRDMLKTMIK